MQVITAQMLSPNINSYFTWTGHLLSIKTDLVKSNTGADG